ncbi:hypothetical protein LCGC14_1283000 [marine sediment metagenome]|uniref:Uncharacterized protein n=1 Tax=marine sediment metagenome TaxID=412755 RepID=A0A0F9LFR2_9ZZZZ
MDKCTRPISMKAGIYLLCGRPAKYTVGAWDVCEKCKPVADYYTKKYAEIEGEVNEEDDSRC